MSPSFFAIVAGSVLLALGFGARGFRGRTFALPALPYRARAAALLAGLGCVAGGVEIAEGRIEVGASLGAPRRLVEAAPSFDPLLPLYGPAVRHASARPARDDGFAGITGHYALAWVTPDRIVRGEAWFSGATGRLRLTYDEENGARQVDEALVLARSGVLYVYEGREALITETRVAAPGFEADRFFVVEDSHGGWSIAQRCDTAGRCSPVAVRVMNP